MVKPNYSFEKRQRELVKKKKKEEKLREKAERKSFTGEDGVTVPQEAGSHPVAGSGMAGMADS